MLIDCDTCTMRAIACEDCVVTAILGRPPALEFDDAESTALAVLAEGGLIPHLRLLPQVRADSESEAVSARRPAV